MRNQSSRRDEEFPLVTVGIPTYNGGKKIGGALLSALEQDYPNIEIIISDNCSEDNTGEVCTGFVNEHPQIRYIRQPRNIGLMPNFQFVLDQASGDFFMWLSDDDRLEPGILRQYVKFLTTHRDYSLVSGAIQHWVGDRALFCERDFNFAGQDRFSRMMGFYSKVVYGSIFYGLMTTKMARHIPITNRIGSDWHFVACLAYLGKVRNLDATGYHKRSGGVSKDFKEYAKVVQARSFPKRFPHLQIAIDAFRDILLGSPVYAREPYLMRAILACGSFCSIFFGYVFRQYPFILGGKIKRAIGLRTSRQLNAT